MRRLISSIFVYILLGGFTVAASQLPPEIMADRYLLQAERFLAEGDYVAALDAMNEVVALQSEHDLKLPDEFDFKYAQVAFSAGLNDAAIDSVTRYLVAAGREGEFYREALALLDEAEAAKAAVEAAMRQAGETRVFDGMEFVWVPPGEFRMGSTEADNDEEPVTRAHISRGFWLGKYEVTQAKWQTEIGTTPSDNTGCAQCPVEQVSWHDAQDFIRSLNGRCRCGNVYRLPTEAEWEYAARAGTTGDRYGNLDAIGWHDGNSGNRTHPVGQKAPNAWGLYDMLGNVYEWVGDWYDEYPGGAVTDPQGPASSLHGTARVHRGGGWPHSARYSRAGDRNWAASDFLADFLGFRLLRTE